MLPYCFIYFILFLFFFAVLHLLFSSSTVPLVFLSTAAEASDCSPSFLGFCLPHSYTLPFRYCHSSILRFSRKVHPGPRSREEGRKHSNFSLTLNENFPHKDINVLISAAAAPVLELPRSEIRVTVEPRRRPGAGDDKMKPPFFFGTKQMHIRPDRTDEEDDSHEVDVSL